MKIAIVTPQLGMGGAEKMVYELAKRLKGQGDDVTVMASPGYYAAKLQELGITVFNMPLAKQERGLTLKAGMALGRRLRSGAYDVIHVQTVPLVFWVRALQRLYGIPSRTVLTVHGSPEWKLRLAGPLLRLLRVERCAVSKRLASLIQGRYIPNAVDIPEKRYEKSSNNNSEKDINKDSSKDFKKSPEKSFKRNLEENPRKLPKEQSLKVMIIARLVPEKGLDLWFKAVEDLENQGISIDTLVIGDGPERKKLEQFVKDKNLATDFKGWQSEPWKDRAERELLVLPSRREGEPLVLLEALAAGLPVLATRVGGIPDMLTGAGLLVEPTALGLAAGVKAFLNQSDEKKEKHCRQAQRVLQTRSWEASVEAYRKIYGQGPLIKA